MHTNFSFDSDELPENYLKQATARGDTHIGFTDHCEYNNPSFPTIVDFDLYFSVWNNLANKYPNIKILKGVEFGYADGVIGQYKQILKKYPFDYCILSIHTVGTRGDCFDLKYYDGLDKRAAYGQYLDETLKAVRSDIDFKILGHIGYITRYAPYADKSLVYGDFASEIDKILIALIDRGAALEINTSAAGLPTKTVTDISIIARYVELGGKTFTFGSDAHSVVRYAQNAEFVKNLLTSLGINYVVRYENGMQIKEFFE